MELKQSLRQTQQLVMTPQLQQAIKLLQLSGAELLEEVRRELDENITLTEEASERPDEYTQNLQNDRNLDENQFQAGDDSQQASRAAREVDWEKFLENRSLQQTHYSGRGGFDDLPPIEQNLSAQESLTEHLLAQLMTEEFVENEIRFGYLVIHNLDEQGYLDLSGVERPDGTRTADLTIEDLALEAGLDPEDAPYVLEMIQRFDPVGVAARDIRECLLVQADVRGMDDLEVTIIRDHLDLLERHNYQAIAKATGSDLEEVYEAAKEIRELDSRPARNFYSYDDKSIGITPDVFVVREGDEFVVQDSERGAGEFHINEALIQQLMQSAAAKEYLGEKLKNAQWLMRSIEQRRKTILRVSECLVEKQKDFFIHGVSHLRPMILRDIAETLGMHESTVSRVTTRKYMQTPQGLFELKYFFNSSIRRGGDEDIASESVRQNIKQIIESEPPKKPLSDQAIVAILKEKHDIEIARRTVAKYREALGILSSSRRKVVM